MKIKAEYREFLDIGTIRLSKDKTMWHPDYHPHREVGPAVVYVQGFQYWYKDGKLHREDGPAVLGPDGTYAWWINGKQR